MDNQQLLDIYFMMNKIRKFEEKALHLFEANKLRGSVHLCIGQEATPATVCSLLNEDDTLPVPTADTAIASPRAPTSAMHWPS